MPFVASFTELYIKTLLDITIFMHDPTLTKEGL